MIFPNDRSSCNNKKIEQIKKKNKNQNTTGNKCSKKTENSKDLDSIKSVESDIPDINFSSPSIHISQDGISISPSTEKTLTLDPSKEIQELLRNMSDFQEDQSIFDEESTSQLSLDKKTESALNKTIIKSTLEKNDKSRVKVTEEASLKEMTKRTKTEQGITLCEKEKSDSKKSLNMKEKNDKITVEQVVGNHAGDSKGKTQTKPNKPLGNERFEKISAFTESNIEDIFLEEESIKIVKPSPHKVKMLRPSEIPMWKNRTKFSRKAKHISLLMENPAKETESSCSLDYHIKKPCSPIEEVSICSEGQSEEKVYIKYKSQRKESPGTPDKSVCNKISLEGKVTEKNIGDNVQLNRCTKISHIPLISELPCYELTAKQSETNYKAKLLDLQVVKSASTTALTSTSAYFGLETIHKKGMKRIDDEKLEDFGKKFQIPVFSALVGKNSKKNLSSRLSCKESKPGYKNKVKNDRNELFTQTSQASHKNANENMKIVKQLLASGKVSQSSSQETKKDFQGNEERSNAVRKLPVKGKSLKNKDNLKKPVNSQEQVKKEKVHFNIGKEKKRSSFTSDDLDFEEFFQKSLPTFEDFSEKNNKKSKNFFPSTPPLTPVDKTRQQGNNVGQNTEKTAQKSGTSDKTSQNHPNSFSKCDEGKRTEVKAKTLAEKKLKIAKNERESSLSKVKLEDLALRGTALNIFITTPFNNNCDSSSKLDADLNASSDAKSEPVNAFEWLYLNYKKCSEQLYKNVTNICSVDAIPTVEEENNKNEEEKKPDSAKYKKEEGIKSESEKETGDSEIPKKKKKSKSAQNDRRSYSYEEELPASTKENDQDTLSLSKCSSQELKSERNEIFEGVKGRDLRRRISEPGSFRGFLWKRVDSETPRGNKASVSSVASSLKHLNTDELEDFIFWEAVPQAMTACWEMSLYHLKRPWSVLSCAIFKYNRESSTPGMILSNLRKGSDKNVRQSTPNEKLTTRVKNSFDIEPSIAQKNIDIKNWLAALNFPTASSTPFDTINEGDFNTRFANADTSSINKSMIPTKQKKSITKSKFTEEVVEKKSENKKQFKSSRKWDSGERGSLKDLIRRKSGGFVTCEQFLNPEIASTENVIHLYEDLSPTDAVTEDLAESSTSKAEVTERGEGLSRSTNEDEIPSDDEMIQSKRIEVLKEVKTSLENEKEKEIQKASDQRSPETSARPLSTPRHPLYRLFRQLLLFLGCIVGMLFVLQLMEIDLDSLF